MSYLKVLALFAGAVAVLTAFAATASATTMTESGSVKATKIHATNEKGHVKITNTISTIECASTLEAKITGQGGVGNPVVGTIEKWEFTGCTNNWKVTAAKTGTMTVPWKNVFEGTWSSTGLEIHATRLAVQCVYLTAGTEIGAFTDTSKTGNSTATLHVNAKLALDLEKSSGLCGAGSGAWSGSYLFGTPDKLYIDEN